MHDRSPLTLAQRQAAQAPDDRPLLIEAGPGSGKTRVITHRAAWLVAERGLAPWELLCIAFTTAAANLATTSVTRFGT